MNIYKVGARAATALLLGISLVAPAFAAETLGAVEKIARQGIPGVKDKRLNTLFTDAMLNTSRQATRTADGTVYVKTGDIPAEWLRDSSAQVRPYLFLARNDAGVRDFLRGVIARQGRYLAEDPYANAFTDTVKPGTTTYKIWEQKYELDSLLYPILLAWTYWKATGDKSIFTGDLSRGFDSALATMELEQHHENSHYHHPEMADNGKGRPFAYTGMIWTGFRPSDDACFYNYLIPSEMMAVAALGGLAEIERDAYNDKTKADRVMKLRKDVYDGIQRYGVVHTDNFGDVYAYEVDGLGNYKLQDDANIPSLLSAPYFGFGTNSDPIYLNTRRFILSHSDPNFFSGKLGRGIGSEHTHNGYIWPLSLVMEALTATTQGERDQAVQELLASDPGDNRLHESFDPNNAKNFTRVDFGWPNALFAEYILVHDFGMPPLPVPSTADLKAQTPPASPAPSPSPSPSP